MDHFFYRENRLFCEQVPLDRIAQAVGTPFYCYSEQTLNHHFQVFQQAFAAYPHLICYSVKANSNLAVLDALVRSGAGLDIVSGGELERAKRVGCPPQRLVYSGVGKSGAEIRAALEYGLLMFNVESVGELERINAVAGELGVQAPISFRVNPDVDPQTHPYISTGLRRNKFGIPHQDAVALYRQAAALPNIRVVGLDCHIGSQITNLNPFVDAVRRIRGLLEELLACGLAVRVLDVGGGLGIPYRAEAEHPPLPAAYAYVLQSELAGLEVTLVLEPGRLIVGNAGVLVTRVEYVKQGPEKGFVIVDAGMNDLLRPAIYDAYHHIVPVARDPERPTATVDVVGPICESGDFFARDRLLGEVKPGELLAVRSTGAYGFTMSSNYNTRPRAAEVLVRGDRWAVVRRRETVADLLAAESLFPV